MVNIDQIIRSRRRSLGLTITSEGRVIVRAPQWAGVSDIERLVNEKAAWIIRKREFFLRRPAPSPKSFCEGEQFLYLGRPCILRIEDDLPKAVVFDGTLRLNRISARNAAEHITQWYRQAALDHIAGRVRHFAGQGGLRYRSVRVNNARTRWGSCSGKGSLNFNWRLIMAPERVVDYVVVHELMHLRQMNHSQRFWSEVAAVIPDYRQDEVWLKENGFLLRIYPDSPKG